MDTLGAYVDRAIPFRAAVATGRVKGTSPRPCPGRVRVVRPRGRLPAEHITTTEARP